MFSGIITQKVKINNIKKIKNSLEMNFDLPSKVFLEEGESVSMNGICSTVVKYTKNDFLVHYMKETLDKTTASNWKVGDLINFEQSLKFNDKISGHFVSGHVDCVGKIVSVENKGEWKMKIKTDGGSLKYIIYKGSVAINGVSLTVSKATNSYFEVSLIPYTLNYTNLGELSKGSSVNIETDLLAKYAENLHAKKRKSK
ncbi:MAG: riboflavin synthase [bacterium]